MFLVNQAFHTLRVHDYYFEIDPYEFEEMLQNEWLDHTEENTTDSPQQRVFVSTNSELDIAFQHLTL
jgi:hypothetical protein